MTPAEIHALRELVAKNDRVRYRAENFPEGEAIAAMLTAFPALLGEVERLRALTDCGVDHTREIQLEQENERLRARIAELEAAGDQMAAFLEQHGRNGTPMTWDVARDWRKARGME